jgi:hypothetical protein
MRLALVVSALTLLAYGLLGGASAWGAGKVFNAELSLRGDCETTKLDPVADPGCPGGTHPGPFVEPAAIVVDSAGNIFVSSRGKEGTGRRIDIFSSAGIYIFGFVPPMAPSSLAIDSQGNLYVTEAALGKAVISRYKPIKYEAASHEIEYPATPTATVINEKEGSLFLSGSTGIAVDPKTDDLFVDLEAHVSLYSSAAEGNELLNDTIGEKDLFNSVKIAVDGARRRLYASGTKTSALQPDVVRVYKADAPYELLETIDGSETPAGKFQTTSGGQSIAVDEEDGSFFVDDIFSAQKVYEFNENYEYVSTYTNGFQNLLAEIEVDNGAASPNKGTLFVPSVKEGPHAYAFKPKEVDIPDVKETFASEVSESEAELHASVNPEGLETEYRFEYVTQQHFEESGFAEAGVVGEGTLPVGKEYVGVSAVATGLEPGTPYRFRAFAENEEGHDEEEGTFTTYEAVGPLPPCENEALRAGLSVALPDCRAYELVTPPSTNGHVPHGIAFPVIRFLTLEASPLGDKVSFVTEGGSLPGLEGGTGAFNGDPYLATRGPKGWITASSGPDGTESQAPQAGTVSPDQGYSFWSTEFGKNDEGSRVIGGQITNYVHYPDGESELIGRGSLGTDPRAVGKFISEGGTHVIFETAEVSGQQLEPDAPPSGTAAVYDRTSDEVTHVVSVLPGNVTPGAAAHYAGASTDGSGIAFESGGVLYLRLDNAETYEVGKGVTFAGIAEGGERIFYVEGGDLFAFDAGTEERTAFTESGDATVVNVSADGTAAYFVSPSVLTGEEANPNGAKAQLGEENLYLSEEGSLRFVATVTDRDVEGDINKIGGLGVWTIGIGGGTLGRDPSRTTPDGGVLLFESRADLAGYDPEGHAEVYRYDSGAGALACLSCGPTRTPVTGDASLESFLGGGGTEQSFSIWGYVSNLTSDGSRAFFQTAEPLVLSDTDGLLDVYEWEADGIGSCERGSGCIYLISSGASAHNDFLYAVSDSGDDVFFRTRDLLTGSDAETTTSIYDARVGGGFPEEPAEICQGEACRPQLTLPPLLPAPATGPQGSSGNVSEPKTKPCPKGKHRVKRNGKVRCVKKHHKGKRR